MFVFFFKQKTAYEMRISDWSSDVCSSDLAMADLYDDGGPTNGGLSIPTKLVEYLLLGPAYDQRQLQDSPLLGDVWLAFARRPRSRQDLLITPHMATTAASVAKQLAGDLRAFDKDTREIGRASCRESVCQYV